MSSPHAGFVIFFFRVVMKLLMIATPSLETTGLSKQNALEMNNGFGLKDVHVAPVHLTRPVWDLRVQPARTECYTPNVCVGC